MITNLDSKDFAAVGGGRNVSARTVVYMTIFIHSAGLLIPIIGIKKYSAFLAATSLGIASKGLEMGLSSERILNQILLGTGTLGTLCYIFRGDKLNPPFLFHKKAKEEAVAEYKA